MIIKSVKLNNIRSYLDQEIIFPEGHTLLAGDIGSGKSSILLAIEFALFGVKRTLLPASNLLRNGKKEGSVELKFEIEKNEIIIKRFLKRMKDEIKQDAGYIIINGKKKDATAIELKSVIFELLGYPKDSLAKSRDLLYRYTIYTPQEEMRQILFEEKDIRLDTLRKVFNIDKYKKIKENTEIVAKRLRELSRGFELAISGLDIKQKKLKEKQIESKQIEMNLSEANEKIKAIRERIKEKKLEALKLEKDVNELNNLKKDIEVNEVRLKHKLEQRMRNKAEIDKIEEQAKLIEADLKSKETPNLGEISKAISQKENELLLMEKTVREINNKASELKISLKHSKDIRNKIITLDKCPTCEQNVSLEYKNLVEKRELKAISAFEHEHRLFETQANEAEAKFRHLRKELDDARRLERGADIIKIKMQSLNEKKKQVDELNKLQEQTKKEIGSINKNKIELNKKIELFGGIGERHNLSKIELEKLQQIERKLEIGKTGFEKEIEGIKRYILDLEKEVNEKLKMRDKISYMKQLNNWVTNYFIRIVGVIETHIMVQVHKQFSDLFESWFAILIGDETISARLDSEFSPIIEQNGYEAAIESLSGGERTSIALSYRLALNKVINDLVTGIKTRELIMLDEPTDGFSAEQLDKVREVWDKLDMRQVIIVSHESKIESFVDNVIRVNKEEHVSVII